MQAADAAKFKVLKYRASDGVVQPRYDEMQYAEYHGSEGGHFGTWHLDAHEGGDDDEDQRELAVVLMLSDSKSYTGGSSRSRRCHTVARRPPARTPGLLRLSQWNGEADRTAGYYFK